jgi:CTP:molybdopterin cytidylyltransferase MocA/ribosomal protein S18 acetylase RimI-like enzyme
VIAAIILAAGRSSRMGYPKALLPHVDPDRTLIDYLVRSAIAAGAFPVLVVGSPQDAKLDHEATAAGGTFIPNADADQGQLSSVLAGLAEASALPDCEAVIVTPVDVPLIKPATIERLITAHATSPALILRATHRGQHGHPVLFKREVFDELRHADRSVGARAVVRSHPGRVLDIEVDDPGVVIDVDTPADYERVFGRPVGPLVTSIVASAASMRIRPATLDDAAALSRLGAATFRETFEGENTPEDMSRYLADAFNEERQAAEIADPEGAVLLAEHPRQAGEPELVGYAHVVSGAVPEAVRGPAPLELKRLYVARPWQGRRVAHALMDAAIDAARARGAQTLWLGVWERNPRALAFYAKYGFVRVGEHTFTLGADVQTDWLLARPITR